VAQVRGSAADSAAIVAAIDRWERAWRTRDAALAAQDYSNDADWTNAFGMRRHGRNSIQALLAQVFTGAAVMAGQTRYQYHDLSFVNPDVALLRSRAIRTGQQLPNGHTEAPRHINHLRVFVKHAGRWLILSHLIADERTPGQPR
jgi:uncharacterized protein (TIGR02246 family)